MKTQTINLESYDDLASVLDKISRVKDGQLLLVWPHRRKLFNRKLDLLLIKRHCDSLAIALAIVVRDLEIQELALAANIPIFRSMRQAQSTPWDIVQTSDVASNDTPAEFQAQLAAHQDRTHNAQTERLTQPALRTAIFSLGILSVIAVGAVVLPRAEIDIQPTTEMQETSLIVSANESNTSVDLAGALPAEIIQVVVEGRESVASSGTVPIPENSAAGKIVITNLTNQNITIPAGTKISSTIEDAPSFFTLEDAQLDVEVNASIEVAVKAANPGVAGNVSAGTLVIIENPLGLSVSVTNPLAMTGGSARSTTAPSQSDYDLLNAQLLFSLRDSAFDEVKSKISSQDMILSNPTSTTIILKEEYSPTSIEPANELTLVLQVQFEFQIIKRADLLSLATNLLDRSLPVGYHAEGDPVQVNNLSDPVWSEDSSASWQVEISRIVYSDHVDTGISEKLRGVSFEQAKIILANQFSSENDPIINLFPKWWPRLPFVHFRISVNTN